MTWGLVGNGRCERASSLRRGNGKISLVLVLVVHQSSCICVILVFVLPLMRHCRGFRVVTVCVGLVVWPQQPGCVELRVRAAAPVSCCPQDLDGAEGNCNGPMEHGDLIQESCDISHDLSHYLSLSLSLSDVGPPPPLPSNFSFIASASTRSVSIASQT